MVDFIAGKAGGWKCDSPIEGFIKYWLALMGVPKNHPLLRKLAANWQVGGILFEKIIRSSPNHRAQGLTNKYDRHSFMDIT
ncbi:hypothetical protein [Burkholderia sp. LMG 32019]|uniref:hypothetical protein n=1 Tax=Burkholderia sp. LMG 32019 TaxID=3158173 RepID=UPI003C30086C